MTVWLRLAIVNLIQDKLYPDDFILCKKKSDEVNVNVINSGIVSLFHVHNFLNNPMDRAHLAFHLTELKVGSVKMVLGKF